MAQCCMLIVVVAVFAMEHVRVGTHAWLSQSPVLDPRTTAQGCEGACLRLAAGLLP